MILHCTLHQYKEQGFFLRCYMHVSCVYFLRGKKVPLNASSLIVGVFSASPGCVRLSIQCFRRRRNQISIRAIELRNATDKEVVERVGGSEKEAVERVEGSPLSISLTLVTSLRPDRSYNFLASIQLLAICREKKC